MAAHSGISLNAGERTDLVAFLEQIGSQEVMASPPAADTAAPSVPPGFAAAKALGRPRLTWGASTDNVGVTGYAAVHQRRARR